MLKRSPTGVVYVVDDDPDVLGSLRFLLETEGFRVETFADATALLAGPLPRPCDCLLIDYNLGSVDGLEVVRRLRALDVSTPVLLITVFEGLDEKAAALGIREILLKPHLEDSVVNRVAAAMAGSAH